MMLIAELQAPTTYNNIISPWILLKNSSADAYFSRVEMQNAFLFLVFRWTVPF